MRLGFRSQNFYFLSFSRIVQNSALDWDAGRYTASEITSLQDAHPLSVDNLRICQQSIFSRSLHCTGMQEDIPMGVIVLID